MWKCYPLFRKKIKIWIFSPTDLAPFFWLTEKCKLMIFIFIFQEHNYGKFASKIDTKESFEIRIVLAFQKLYSFVPEKVRNCILLDGQIIAKHPVFYLLWENEENLFCSLNTSPLIKYFIKYFTCQFSNKCIWIDILLLQRTQKLLHASICVQ